MCRGRQGVEGIFQVKIEVAPQKGGFRLAFSTCRQCLKVFILGVYQPFLILWLLCVIFSYECFPFSLFRCDVGLMMSRWSPTYFYMRFPNVCDVLVPCDAQIELVDHVSWNVFHMFAMSAVWF